MVNFFIIAHACKLPNTFTLGNNKLYFKGQDNVCHTDDATYLDLDKTNYRYQVIQNQPTNPPNDYLLNFYDATQEFGLNAFGVFSEDGNRIIEPNPDGDILLSQIIDSINQHYGRPNNFYLQICRAPCQTVGGKRRKTLKKSLKKKRKNKKRTYKK